MCAVSSISSKVIDSAVSARRKYMSVFICLGLIKGLNVTQTTTEPSILCTSVHIHIHAIYIYIHIYIYLHPQRHYTYTHILHISSQWATSRETSTYALHYGMRKVFHTGVWMSVYAIDMYIYTTYVSIHIYIMYA